MRTFPVKGKDGEPSFQENTIFQAYTRSKSAGGDGALVKDLQLDGNQVAVTLRQGQPE